MSGTLSNEVTPTEFVASQGWQYKRRAEWIDVKICPFCQGGSNGHKDLHTFAVHSVEGTYVCLRGGCGVKGNFSRLQQKFGIPRSNSKLFFPRKNGFKVPNVRLHGHTSPYANTGLKYLTSRGFSLETVQECGIKFFDDGKIAFTYDDGFGLCFVKYRRPEKHLNGPKAEAIPGGKRVLWRLEKASPSLGPLVIVFGEYDAMALVECGIPNACSIPSGDKDIKWIDLDWDRLEKFSDIVLWPDQDESGLEAAQTISKRLGLHRVRIVETSFKDPNDALYHLTHEYGKEEAVNLISDMVKYSRPVSYDKLIRVYDVEDDEVVSDGISYGFSKMDKYTGGSHYGEVTVWAGENFAGKTTGVLGFSVCSSLEAREPVFIYSGEMKKSKIKYWTELMLAGPEHLEPRISERTSKTYYEIEEEAKFAIREWYKDLYYLYDSPGSTSEELAFEAAEYAFKRYGCRRFVFDNLLIMTGKMRGDDEFAKQTRLVNKCKEFANKNDVSLDLIAHCRKNGDPREPPTKASVRGASEIMDLADNGFAFWRLPEFVRNQKDQLKYTDTLLCTLKVRDAGQLFNLQMVFDESSKRFGQQFSEGPMDSVTRRYAWETR